MSTNALRIVTGLDMSSLKEVLEARLKQYKVTLEYAQLGRFQTYDLAERTVLIVGPKSDQPFCIVPRNLEGKLLGNGKLRELPMTISCLRTAGKSVRPILNCGAFDAIGITYGIDEFALVIDAGLLLERLK